MIQLRALEEDGGQGCSWHGRGQQGEVSRVGWTDERTDGWTAGSAVVLEGVWGLLSGISVFLTNYKLLKKSGE